MWLTVAGLLVTTMASPVRAEDTWSELARSDDEVSATELYDHEMRSGDNLLGLAVAERRVPMRRHSYIDRAVLAYERAARAQPTSAEPHFRIASALHRFFIECTDDPTDQAALCRGPIIPQIVARLLDHWRAFVTKAPLDPRVTDEVLFQRAILHTKLATRDDLARARDDYRALLNQRTANRDRILTLGNLAETEMMLGDLDASIETYRRVLEIDQRKENYFGLAVALDRDEQGEEAREILLSLGPVAVRYLYERIRDQDIFYVPHGEAYYYLALGHEANGFRDEAIRLYDAFIASGAHPAYAGRARANRDALAARAGAKK